MSIGMMIAVMCICSVFSPRVATATTYYVSPNGSDSNSGSQSAPFHTVGQGLSVMGAGDTLLLKGGTYAENINSNSQKIPSGSSWGNAPQIKAAPGETPVIQPPNGTAINLASHGGPNGAIQYLIFDGLVIDGSQSTSFSSIGFSLNGAQYIRLQNSEIKNFTTDYGTGIEMGEGQGPGGHNEIINVKIHDIATRPSNGSPKSGELSHGLYIRSSDNVFDGLEVFNCGGLGMQLYSGNTKPNRNVIKNSRFYNNGLLIASSGGFFMGVGDGNFAYNNLVYNNAGAGIQIGYGGSGNKAYNNTVYRNREGGILIMDTSSADVRNNLLYGNGSAYGNLSDQGSGTRQSANQSIDAR